MEQILKTLLLTITVGFLFLSVTATILSFFKKENFFTLLKRYLRRHHEFISIPAAIFLWLFSEQVFHALDPFAATLGIEAFQLILFSICTVFIIQGVTWLILKIAFPEVARWLDTDFRQLFTSKNLTTWQRSKLAFGFFALFFVAFVAAVRIL